MEAQCGFGARKNTKMEEPAAIIFLAVLKVFCMGGFALVILLCIFGVLESFLFGPGSHQNSAMAVNRDADDSGVSATRIILDAD